MREIPASTLLFIVTFFRKDQRSLPAVVEFILSWLANFLLAFRYYYGYVRSTQQQLWRPSQEKSELVKSHNIPLITRTRGGPEARTFAQALEQLETLLETMRQKKDDDTTPIWKDPEGLVQLMRSSVEARTLASQAMWIQRESPNKTCTDNLPERQKELWTQIQQQWLELLKLPSSDDTTQDYPYQLSLVVPVYAEKGSHVQQNLQRALSTAKDPSQIQLILVDAGKNSDLELATKFDDQKWGNVQVISYTGGGGRGPTLNVGAQHSTGKVLTFLHADNILPPHWDEEIRTVFDQPEPIACAFSFRIHTDGGRDQYPPGLSSAQWMGTLRSERFGVLYGDSVLSMPAVYFRYLGGYPHQALMEDYEVMDLLRRRVALFSKTESVVILPAETLISPRRWQDKGVTYVTLFNCLCVFLYQERGWSPEQLYKFYYQR